MNPDKKNAYHTAEATLQLAEAQAGQKWPEIGSPKRSSVIEAMAGSTYAGVIFERKRHENLLSLIKQTQERDWDWDMISSESGMRKIQNFRGEVAACLRFLELSLDYKP